MPVTRRTILRYGIGGAVTLAIGGLGLSLQSTALRTPRRQLQVLDQRSYSILAAVADRIAPQRNHFPAASELEVAERVDALLAAADPAQAAEVKQVLHLLENALAGALLDFRPRPFTRLAPEAQDDTLRSWQTSALPLLRTAYSALHGLCAAAYYAQPAIYGRVGYPGPPAHLVNR